MPKQVEFWMMRHGPQMKTSDPDGGIWQPNAPLSAEGEAMVAGVATAIADVTFTAYYVSTLLRALVSGEVVARAHGRTHVDVHPTTAFAPHAFEPWDEAVKAQPNMATPVDIYTHFPDLMHMEGQRAYSVILEIARTLTDGQKAFGVSHQPIIEAAAATAERIWPPQHEVDKGEFLIFTFVDDVFAGCIERAYTP